jgi:hypothetical protein
VLGRGPRPRLLRALAVLAAREIAQHLDLVASAGPCGPLTSLREVSLRRKAPASCAARTSVAACGRDCCAI